jgi:di/tricarboxylate transporter
VNPFDSERMGRIGQVSFLVAGAFFLLFGVHLLLCAYRLKDPFSFIMTFFASNLIILISATVMTGLAIRLAASFRKTKDDTVSKD